MASASRCISLRRPPTLVAANGRFVPEGVTLDTIDVAWRQLCDRNPRLFDGPLWHVSSVSRNGCGGATVHVMESSYRFHAVRAARVETGVRPLGVKAFIWRDGRVLMGRRADSVHIEPGRWEFVPGGTLVPGRQPAEEVTRELEEEAGWSLRSSPSAIALLYDDHACTWEIVHRAEGMRGDRAPSWEYSDLREHEPATIGALALTHAAKAMCAILPTDSASPSPRMESGGVA